MQLQILDTLELFPHVKIKHVKGHQDSTLTFDEIPWEGKLNIFADQLATEALNELDEDLHVPHVPAGRIYI